MTETTELWDTLYRDDTADGPDPGPNAVLADVLTDLPAPGAGVRRALDLGAGRGGDTLWLAGRGWDVTAVDVAAHVLHVLDERADRLGLATRVHTEHHDLATSLPERPEAGWDLVTACYLHPVTDIGRPRVLATLARSLAPDGHLVVVDHASRAPWSWGPDAYPSPEALGDSFDPGDGVVAVVRERRTRTAQGPGGQVAQVADDVLVLRRTTGEAGR